MYIVFIYCIFEWLGQGTGEDSHVICFLQYLLLRQVDQDLMMDF